MQREKEGGWKGLQRREGCVEEEGKEKETGREMERREKRKEGRYKNGRHQGNLLKERTRLVMPCHDLNNGWVHSCESIDFLTSVVSSSPCLSFFLFFPSFFFLFPSRKLLPSSLQTISSSLCLSHTLTYTHTHIHTHSHIPHSPTMEVSNTFLPQSIATLISTVSLGARVSLRTAAIIVEASGHPCPVLFVHLLLPVLKPAPLFYSSLPRVPALTTT